MQEYVCNDCGNIFESILKPNFCPSCFNTSVKMTLKTLFFDDLEKLFESHQSPNWGGYGELPASKKSYKKAVIFAQKLDGLPYPECNIDTDGDICFEWPGENKIFSVSFSERIIFVGIFDGYTKSGVISYSHVVPAKIKRWIKQIFA